MSAMGLFHIGRRGFPGKARQGADTDRRHHGIPIYREGFTEKRTTFNTTSPFRTRHLGCLSLKGDTTKYGMMVVADRH